MALPRAYYLIWPRKRHCSEQKKELESRLLAISCQPLMRANFIKAASLFFGKMKMHSAEGSGDVDLSTGLLCRPMPRQPTYWATGLSLMTVLK